jgi:predicted acyl esterase
MLKRTGIALSVSGLTVFGLYRYRRSLLSRLLGLPSTRYGVAVERGLRVPMPDGAEMVADRYHPRSSGRFSTVPVRTPYGRKKGDRPLVMRLLAERGYNALIQDVRGRFDSEGGVWLPCGGGRQRPGDDGVDL